MDRTITPTSRAHLRLWLWVGSALACLLLGGLKVWQNQQRWMALRSWRGQVRARQTAGRQAQQKVRELFRRRLSREEAEEALNNGRPFRMMSRDQIEVARYVDPASGWLFELRFRDGQWTDYRLAGNPSPPAPPQPSVQDLPERARRWTCRIAPIVWLAALLAVLVFRNHRCLTAEVLLAAAIVPTLGWLVAPNYSLTFGGITSNDNLFWGAIMLVVNTCVLLWAYLRREPPVEPLCPTCEYNLTGNVSGVCPECGTPVPATLQAKIARTLDPAPEPGGESAPRAPSRER